MPNAQQMKWIGWLLVLLGFLGMIGTIVLFPPALGIANGAMIFVGSYLVFKPGRRS